MIALHPLSLLSTRRLWMTSGCCCLSSNSSSTTVEHRGRQINDKKNRGG